jgi:uncharacterized membrane protein
MVGWILGFVVAIILVSVYAASQMSPQPNIKIGVSLPVDVLKSREIKDIAGQYRKALLILVLIAAAASVPLFFLLSYVSIAILFLFTWMGVVFYAANRVFSKYHRKLLVLKQNNHWFGKNARIVTIDTEVSRLKDTMPISGSWFILPGLLSLLPFLFAFLNKSADVLLLSFGSVSVVSTLVSLWLYRLVHSESTIFFSTDSAVNLAYNTMRKSTLSRGWLLFALLETTVIAVMSFIIWQYGMAIVIAVVLLFVLSLCGIFIIFAAYHKVQASQQRLKDAENNNVYIDDDSGWENGLMFYNNPYDERTMVEKRSGYGYTINMASKKGKIFMYVTFGFLALLLVGVTGITMWADFGEVEMTMVNDNNTIEIQAPMYGYQFHASDIVSIDMIDDIPGGIRTNGISTNRYSLGNFNINGYGTSKLYIVWGAPYIVIELDDLYVFINGDTEEQTQEYYNQLQELEGE